MNRFDPSQNKPSDSIRSEIDETRDRMNTTIDQLTERLKGRHLVDELLGYFRTSNGTSTAATVKEKVSETTSAAVHAVVDAVKSHPLPILVMGAGLAWLIYEKEQKAKSPARSYAALDPEPRDPSLPPLPESDFEDYTPGYSTAGGALAGSELAPMPGDAASDEPGMKERIQARAGEAKDRLQSTASHLGEKASQLGQKASQGMQHVKERAARTTEQVRERTRELAGRTKDQVSRAAEEHPLETGLACLAVGVLAGLLSPTPARIREEVAPVAERMKQRAREAGGDILERGKRVVAAASDAARREAEEQHLTPEAVLGRTAGQRSNEPAPEPSKGNWPGQTEHETTPTPAAAEAMSGDEQRVAGDIVQPRTSPTPPM